MLNLMKAQRPVNQQLLKGRKSHLAVYKIKHPEYQQYNYNLGRITTRHVPTAENNFVANFKFATKLSPEFLFFLSFWLIFVEYFTVNILRKLFGELSG